MVRASASMYPRGRVPRVVGRGRGLLLMALVGLAACQSPGRYPRESVTSRTIRLATPNRLTDFSLARTYRVAEAQFAALLFEGLTQVDETGAVHPALARDWTVSPDGLRYRFHLRDDVRFHDGTLFRAGDVVRAWTEALRRAPGEITHPWMLDDIVGAQAYSTGRAGSIAGLQVVDDSTLEVRLAHRVAMFPSLLAVMGAAVPAASSDAHRPVGTGPWRWVRGGGEAMAEIWLARNEGYWGGAAPMDSMVVRFVPDSLQAEAFEAGYVDITSDLLLDGRTRLAARSDVGFAWSPSVGYLQVTIAARDPAFADVRVRRALNHAIDPRRLAEAVAADNGIRAVGAIPPGMPGHDPDREPYVFDPELARRLLREGGYPPTRPLRLAMPMRNQNVYPTEIGALIRDSFEAIGLVVELTHADEYVTALAEGKADLLLSAWIPDYGDPDAFLYPLFHSSAAGAAGNDGEFRDAEVDRLIDASRRELDPVKRAALLRAADQRVYEQAPAVFLWFIRQSVAYSFRLGGWKSNGFNPRFTNLYLAGERLARR